MKKPISFLLILFVACIGFSCKKQLELSSPSQLSAGSFYKTSADLDQAVIACYDALQSGGEYGQNFLYLMEVVADNAKTSSITNSGGIYGDFDLFRATASNAVLDKTWSSCYLGIQRCNIVLNRAPWIPMVDSLKNIRVAEAKFIRALTYFNMVRIWGGVPLVTKEVENPFSEFDHGRDDVAAVYTQIVKDLTEASAELPLNQTGANLGRVTKGAALTLLGKVYLTQKNYTAAASTLATVVSNAANSLLPLYADIFKSTNKNNKETIFEIQFKKASNGEGSSFTNLFATDATLVSGVGQALGDDAPSKAFIDSFQLNDLRKAATIGVSAGKNYCKKFIDATPAANLDGDNNFIVLRYADVLLMLAEALNETGYAAGGDAFKYINMVRARAGLPDLTGTTTPDQQSFRRAVEVERKYELSFENHRWFDLLRTGRAITVMSTTPSDNGPITVTSSSLLFQIPQSQIDVKPGLIIQNP